MQEGQIAEGVLQRGETEQRLCVLRGWGFMVGGIGTESLRSTSMIPRVTRDLKNQRDRSKVYS